MEPLLDAIVDLVPAPPGSPDEPFAMLVAMIERDPFLGRIVTGRVASGQAKIGDRLLVFHHSGTLSPSSCVPPSTLMIFLHLFPPFSFFLRLAIGLKVQLLPFPPCFSLNDSAYSQVVLVFFSEEARAMPAFLHAFAWPLLTLLPSPPVYERSTDKQAGNM